MAGATVNVNDYLLWQVQMFSVKEKANIGNINQSGIELFNKCSYKIKAALSLLFPAAGNDFQRERALINALYASFPAPNNKVSG